MKAAIYRRYSTDMQSEASRESLCGVGTSLVPTILSVR